MKPEEVSVGMPVHVTSSQGVKQNGMVKGFHEANKSYVFVVFNCNNDWDNYKDYTGQICDAEGLTAGWYIDTTPRRIKYMTEAFSMQPITMNVTEDEPVSNGGKMNCCKKIIFEKLVVGHKCGDPVEELFYCGYNFYDERIFQFLHNSVNIGYFPEGFKP
jgi:hypothetical protein